MSHGLPLNFKNIFATCLLCTIPTTYLKHPVSTIFPLLCDEGQKSERHLFGQTTQGKGGGGRGGVVVHRVLLQYFFFLLWVPFTGNRVLCLKVAVASKWQVGWRQPAIGGQRPVKKHHQNLCRYLQRTKVTICLKYNFM